MTNWTGLIAVSAAVVAAATSLAVEDSTGPSAGPLTGSALNQSLSEAANRLDTAGFDGHVSVSLNGEIVFVASLGPADPVTGTPYSLVTQTDIGSITKSVTGLLASRLIADGRLDPNSTLADWFEAVPADKANITVHQLLTHSAGFPPAIGDDYAEIGREAFVRQALAADLQFEPGTAYAYSNVGISLTGAIIERASGESLETHLQSVLEPLGLSDTGYAAVISTTRAVRTGRGADVATASWGGDAASDYGYGIVVEDHPLYGRFYWHNGGNAYFTNHFRVLPEPGVVIFATSNARGVDPDVVAEVMSAAVYGRQIDIAAQPAVDFDRTVDLPDTAAGVLARAFIDTLNADQPSDWQAFIETRTSQAFQELVPMEEHLGMFRSLHQDFASAAIYAVDEGDDEIRLVMGQPDGPLARVTIGHEPAGDDRAMSGLSIDGF
ncbi:serine hydrolase domain-containing protein [Hyphobacterium sp.]|uniref:serine hydrolase domain-containing protein n=1 Tax=Hyphobacterium sp. TaxID=2004662 RepID=UPI003B517894